MDPPSPSFSSPCHGSGITEGLHLVWFNGKFMLEDRSNDKRFAEDVKTWAEGVSLNTPSIKKKKKITNATK